MSSPPANPIQDTLHTVWQSPAVWVAFGAAGLRIVELVVGRRLDENVTYYKALREDFEALKAESDKREDLYRSRMTAAQDENDGLRKQIRDLETKIFEKDLEIRQLTSNVNEMRGQIKQLQAANMSAVGGQNA